MPVKTVIEAYKCGTCSEVHDDEDDARDCCKPYVIEGYVCVPCKTFYSRQDTAERCCKQAKVEIAADEECCFICNARPLTLEDVRDSRILGSVLRCRSHILAVAPELLTADAIATRREAA